MHNRPVIDGYEPIVCVGGPGHGRSYPGHNYPKIELPYLPLMPWNKIWAYARVDAQDYFAMTYELQQIRVELSGLRLDGWCWRWDQLNEDECIKAALGLVLASAILHDSEGAQEN